MTTLFISDLHLCAKKPEISELFLRFLKEEAKNIDALYILGDFFESWIGDDNPNLHDKQIIDALRTFSESEAPVYFMHGNRDFLLSKAFAKRNGMTLLPDPCSIELYGKTVVLSHGDLLCTLDTGYQRFRKLVRHPLVKKLFLKLPLSSRSTIAKFLRGSSIRTKSTVPSKKVWKWDVALREVYSILRKYQSHILIHGHTHKPKIHDFVLNSCPAKRIVLGDWGTTGSVLVYAPESIQLKTIS